MLASLRLEAPSTKTKPATTPQVKRNDCFPLSPDIERKEEQARMSASSHPGTTPSPLPPPTTTTPKAATGEMWSFGYAFLPLIITQPVPPPPLSSTRPPRLPPRGRPPARLAHQLPGRLVDGVGLWFSWHFGTPMGRRPFFHCIFFKDAGPWRGARPSPSAQPLPSYSLTRLLFLCNLLVRATK